MGGKFHQEGLKIMFLHWIGFKRDLILLKDRLRRVANSVFFGSRSLIYSIYRDCQRNRTCAFRVRFPGSPTIYFALSQVAVSYVHLWCNVRAGSSDLKVRRRPSGECRQVNWLLYDLLVLCQHDEQKDWTLIKKKCRIDHLWHIYLEGSNVLDTW